MPFPAAVVLTNDDGFDAPGLQALAHALEPLCGDALHIVAPDRCYSGGSQQVTMSQPISVSQRGPRQWALGGSPADCARIALTTLVPNCTLVIAGINHGGNLGHDIFLSGTVGAAREAALLGATAVAYSHYLRPGIVLDWPRAAHWATDVLTLLMTESVPQGSLWNVNLPHHAPGDMPAPPVVRCAPCPAPLPIAYTLQDGAYHYDGSAYHQRVCAPGTDVSACFSGSIALSCLQVTPI